VALEWTDALTLVHESQVPDVVYQRARSEFSEKELVDLSWAAVEINACNRLCIAFRMPPQFPPIVPREGSASTQTGATPHLPGKD